MFSERLDTSVEKGRKLRQWLRSRSGRKTGKGFGMANGRLARSYQCVCTRAQEVLVACEGQGMIEYAVIIGVVIVVAVALVIVFGNQIETLFNDVTSALSAI